MSFIGSMMSGGSNFSAAGNPITTGGNATGNSSALTQAQQTQMNTMNSLLAGNPLAQAGGLGSNLSSQLTSQIQNQNAGPAFIMPTNGMQAQQAAAQVQGGLNTQQQLVNALQGQNGIANQSALYGQLGNIASGQGPNPAAAMLNQQTGQNVANQASLMAGQRGASQNAGLIARQAGMQGAATQQQAVGQGATMQANQALAALGQQAGIASQQVGNQIGATQGLTAAQQANQAQILGALQGQNQVVAGQTANQNQANAQIASGAQQQQGNILGGITGGIGSAIGALAAKGGMVKSYAQGGSVMPQYAGGGGITDFTQGVASGPQSSFGQSLANGNSQNNPFLPLGNQLGTWIGQGIKSLGTNRANPIATQAMQNTQAQSSLLGGNATPGPNLGVTAQDNANSGAPSLGADTEFSNQGSDLMAGLAKGGKVPAMVSPGERILSPKEVRKVEKGEKLAIEAGRTVPGKAPVKGDSLKNDVVPMNLAEGTIVEPRSVTQSKTPGKDAQKFVETLLAKQGKGKRAA